MTSVYLDTSILVAGLLDEPLGPSARRAIGDDRGERPLVSEWVVSEFSSAMGLKVRRKELPADKAMEVIAFLDAMIGADFRLVDVARADFHLAARLCRRFDSGLRTPDALHLAIGSAHGAAVLTLDEQMAAAGQALGLDVRLVA